MRIAVDAMGGDFAPRTIVEGAVLALKADREIDKLFLVGDETAVRAELARCGADAEPRIEVRHASQVVEMGEKSALGVRHKHDSSINRSMDLVKSGEAQAVFAAGSTGAAVASATIKLRTLPGIRRPGIAVAMPTPAGKPVLVIDGGATTDCSAEILTQFGIMGAAYSRTIIGREDPEVGLMSVGTEDAKGNSLSKETFEHLQGAPLNFVGNIEGHDVFKGGVDVIVCDGFTGNVILKTSESLAKAVGTWLKTEIRRNPLRILGALLCGGALKSLKRKTSAKQYGGAPLLGINGIVIIGHGNSDAQAAKNGILQAARAVRENLNRTILADIGKFHAVAAEKAAKAAAEAAAALVAGTPYPPNQEAAGPDAPPDDDSPDDSPEEA